MNEHAFKEKYNDIANDIKKILTKQSFTMNEQSMIKVLPLLKEIIKPNDKKNR